ncbi:energy-coupled thiamine transporter ThiT [uncultured Parabacteroides sp.]|uniref:energy-coupled thiamine transporter ThiT n=1 Tax=uncultured Parabacteroides sp. TaxID=512312 RepID=UPI0026764A22|nr:energy-coupled thiamine transporter ThiT [uncultured Parabacteroides sp.]
MGTVLGCLGRFLSIWVTGATLWGEYMPEEFLGLPMTNEWVYSLLYNGIPIGASSAATLAVVLALAATPARRYLLGHDIR